jgi:tetratricopeptide (TPR) repeat protein
MKKITLVLLTFAMALVGTKVSAQGKYGADSAECIKYLSYYQEYYKQKNYDDALPSWRKAVKLCPPTASQNMLLNGMTLLARDINKTKDATRRSEMIDSLLMLNDVRAQYYPRYAVAALNTKGQYITQFFKDPKVVYDRLDEIIAANQENTKPSLLLLKLNSAIDLFKADKLGAEEVINTYQNAIALIGKAEQTEEVVKTKADIEGLFITSQVASCDNLIALFTPRYEADPNNIDLVTNIVKMMGNTEGCQNNDLFLKAVTKMHANEPSAASAYYLYKLHAAQDDNSTAVKYLEEALGFSDLDAATKANYQLELATFALKSGMNAKSFEAARKAAELDPANQGKAYYIIGTLWGSVRCGGNEVERRANYWVAVDYLQKAKAADESLTADCNRLIGSYSVYYPQKAEAFMYDIVDGQSYTVNCGGMHATTTVRTQK